MSFESKNYREFYLNELMSCELQTKEEISIHLEWANAEQKKRLFVLLKSGLNKLAELLERESRLRNVKLISAISWIVTEHPNLFTKAGFSIDNKGWNFIKKSAKYKSRKGNIPTEKLLIAPSYAFISRDDFTRRYKGKDPMIYKKNEWA